jgi:nitrite reductase/ring-hydroxylating ferredoxin subunit
MDEKEISQTISHPPGPAAGGTTRRGFLLRFGILLNLIGATLFAIPVIGYVLSPVRRFAWLRWITLGSIDEFPEHQTRLASYHNPFAKPWDGATDQIPCWVRRMSGESFQIFAINCAHLGCPVRWFQESGLFMCPCHGGVYYADGRRASGPPPRGLYQYQYKIENGKLWIKAGELPTLGEPIV